MDDGIRIYIYIECQIVVVTNNGSDNQIIIMIKDCGMNIRNGIIIMVGNTQ